MSAVQLYNTIRVWENKNGTVLNYMYCKQICMHTTKSDMPSTGNTYMSLYIYFLSDDMI